ncbi:alpha/beta hydrolase, partial [Micromonospora sp. M51]|nr:alpha/beta hydrolase [Micromonospora sp. M51]
MSYRIPRPRTAAGRVAGIVGAAVGVAAAGLAAGVATERTLVRRLKADPADRYAHETFDEQRY